MVIGVSSTSGKVHVVCSSIWELWWLCSTPLARSLHSANSLGGGGGGKVWSSQDEGAVVDVVGPLGDRGVTHGAMPCFCLAAAVVSTPGCVYGVGLNEVQEGRLRRFEVSSERVGGLLIPACGESSVVLLAVQPAPKCAADLPGHDPQEVGCRVHVVRGAGDGPVEGSCGFDIVRA